jgi:thymidylate synthase ThyX
LDAEEVLGLKKEISRFLFKKAFSGQEQCYRWLEQVWADELKPESKFKAKKEITSMMRRIVGMGVATGGVWTGNVRALRHVITMRAAPEAEEEILHVFTRVAKMMRDAEPMLFGDFEQIAGKYWVPKYRKV